MNVTVKFFYHDDEPMKKAENNFECFTWSGARESLEELGYKKDDEMQKSFRGFDSDEIWIYSNGNYAKVKEKS